MSSETIRSLVKASIWQALAQSSVDLSSLSQEDQETLVEAITEKVVTSLGEGVEKETPDEAPVPQEVEGHQEEILWKGRPFLSLKESYVVTTERIKIITGLIGRHVENYELIRVQDIDYKQGIFERIFGLGDISIEGQDASAPVITLRNVPRPEELYEILRKAWLAARQRHGLQFREYM